MKFKIGSLQAAVPQATKETWNFSGQWQELDPCEGIGAVIRFIASSRRVRSTEDQVIQDANLFGRHILLVEDDYLQGFSIRNELLDRGAAVIGPLGHLEGAFVEAKSKNR